MVFDVVSVQVGKEFLEPFVHDLMVRPAMLKFCQQDGSSLDGLISERREHMRSQVVFDRLPVSLIQLTRPVVRRSLGAHIIAGTND